MSSLERNSSTGSQYDKTMQSSLGHKSDYHSIDNASGNIPEVLHLENHSLQSDSTDNSTQSFSGASREMNSQTLAKIDSQDIIPLGRKHDFGKEGFGSTRTLIPITEWEGYVEGIFEDEFSVKMVNVRSKSPLPADEATFHKDQVSKHDRQLLREGAIVRWVIGRERLSTGQVRNVSELYFRRLPAHTEKDYRRAYAKAGHLLEGINWDNETERR